jgi:hypothetical protein
MQTTYKFGNGLEIVPTNDRHVSVRIEPTSINGVQLNVHAHMFLWDDGRFHIGEPHENDFQRNYHQLYISRPASDPKWKQGPSEAARKKVIELLNGAVNEWYRLNHSAMTQAAHEDLKRQIRNLESEVAEIAAQLDAKTKELLSLKRQIPAKPQTAS